MQIYSNADLTLIPVPYRQHTLGALTQGFTVTNYSDVAFQVSSNSTGDLGVIPPYFARTFGCKAGDTIQFIPSDLQTAALPQTIMFLNVDESSGGVIPSQTPLAQVPGYALDVQGSVSLAGIGQVAIQGTPTVQVLGAIEANIQNAILQSEITNAYLGVKAVANSIQYLPLAYMPATTGSMQIIPPDSTLNLKELHVDFMNEYTTVQSPYLYIGPVNTSQCILAPQVPGSKGSIHLDLTFGTGVPLDTGIYGNADVASTMKIQGGYAIVQAK